MRLGDVLEWAAGTVGVFALNYWRHNSAVSLLGAALFLFYQAQCHSQTPLRFPGFITRWFSWIKQRIADERSG